MSAPPARLRAGLLLLALLAAAGLLAPWLAGDPLAIDLEAHLRPPGADHWMGTDELGRDLFARVTHAARPALVVAIVATGLSLLIGIPIGAAAGYAGPRVDLILSRLIEAALSFPSLVLLLLVTAVAMRPTMGDTPGGDAGRSILVVGVAVGIARWGVIARYMRAEILRLAGTELAQSAKAAGGGPLRILGLHLAPLAMGPVTVSAAFGAGTAVIAEASLSFLGMGVRQPEPTWGQILASSVETGASSWWLLLFPGVMVALLVGAFNLVGEGLRQRARG